MSDLLPLFPLPNVVLFPNVFLPLHIFEPRYREMVADALDERSHDRHGAAAAGLGARLRRAAARLPDRLQRRHHARRAAGRRPLQHRAARRRAVPDRRGGREPQLSPRASSSRCAERTLARDDRAAIRRQRSKLEALLAPAVERSRWPTSSRHGATRRSRRRCPTRISSTRWRSTSTSSRSRSRRCSSSTSLRVARRVARRAARDEDPDGADARRRPTSRTESSRFDVASATRAVRDHLDDLLAVEAAVLDEDRAGVDAGDRAAGDEQAGHVGLERLRIVNAGASRSSNVTPARAIRSASAR